MKQGGAIWSCGVCDYDICETCYLKNQDQIESALLAQVVEKSKQEKAEEDLADALAASMEDTGTAGSTSSGNAQAERKVARDLQVEGEESDGTSSDQGSGTDEDACSDDDQAT